MADSPGPPIELNAELRHAMERETQMVFSTIMHEDRSVSELIESDYTFLNQKLASAYGLTNLGVTGTKMRRVTLPPDSPRGGVLTEGTVLVVTSNPDRTSPVKRGLFVLNNILGAAPPPPPPNVPALEVAEKDITRSRADLARDLGRPSRQAGVRLVPLAPGPGRAGLREFQRPGHVARPGTQPDD